MVTVRSLVLLAVVSLAVVAPPPTPSFGASDDVVVAMQTFVQRFDPTAMLSFIEYVNYALVFDGLINLGPNGKEPGLATEWHVAQNGLTIDFALRRGVRFHNGDPLTGEDVKFTFERVIAPDSSHPYRKGFQEVLERIEVVAPDRVRFHLKKAWPTFFTAARYGLQPIIPKAYYEKVGPRGFQSRPVGTGPYRLAGTTIGESTHFTRNPDYWGAAPAAKTITLKLVAEAFTRLAMLARGEADVIDSVIGAILEQVRQNPSLKLVVTPHAGTTFLQFNRRTNPEFKDRRLRLAVAHALDRKGIADTILGRVCEPAVTHFTPATFGYVAGLKGTSYDPDRARALMKEAGFVAGQPINFLIHTTPLPALPGANQALEAMAGQLEAVGFKLQRQLMDTGAYVTGLRTHTIAGLYYGPATAPDDGGVLMDGYFHSAGAFANEIKVPEYDALLKRQLNEGNTERRLGLLQQWARLEDERVESAPLFWCGAPFATGPKVAEWRPALGMSFAMNLHRLRLATR